LIIGGETVDVELSEMLKTYSLKLSRNPSQGTIMLSVRSIGNSTFDSLTISQTADEPLRETARDTEACTDYRALSESEYLVDRCSSLLIFLEACTDYWKLEIADRVVSPSVVFGYANLYELSWLSQTNRRGRLFYVGLSYVREGVVVGMILMPLAWVSAAYCYRSLARIGERRRDPRDPEPDYTEA